ncbi:MAG: hypothetical protein WCP62_15305, partial [Planctomycetota bacterium]
AGLRLTTSNISNHHSTIIAQNQPLVIFLLSTLLHLKADRLEAYPTLDGQLRGKARFTHPTQASVSQVARSASAGQISRLAEALGALARSTTARSATVRLFHQRSISVHQRSRI